MQHGLIVAGGLAVLTGIVHSTVGEAVIFRRRRRRGLVPTVSVSPLRESHIRILWATWHLASIFGFAFAAILFRLGTTPGQLSYANAGELTAIAISNLGAGLLVLVATKGRHPGWVALMSIGAISAHAALSI